MYITYMHFILRMQRATKLFVCIYCIFYIWIVLIYTMWIHVYIQSSSFYLYYSYIIILCYCCLALTEIIIYIPQESCKKLSQRLYGEKLIYKIAQTICKPVVQQGPNFSLQKHFFQSNSTLYFIYRNNLILNHSELYFIFTNNIHNIVIFIFFIALRIILNTQYGTSNVHHGSGAIHLEHERIELSDFKYFVYKIRRVKEVTTTTNPSIKFYSDFSEKKQLIWEYKI